jgi:hypothetical protein
VGLRDTPRRHLIGARICSAAPVVGEATAIRQECAAAHRRAGGEPPMQQLARTAMKRRMTSRDR